MMCIRALKIDDLSTTDLLCVHDVCYICGTNAVDD